MTKKNNAKPAPNNKLPTLYNNLIAIRPDLHGDLKMADNTDKLDFSFAANINAVPIVVHEFGAAIKHYPIVFVGDGSGVMLAVLGVEENENLFVDKKGKWLPDTYIPAYVRRYPFYIAKAPDKDEPILCFDDTSSLLSKDGDKALFKDGKVTEALKDIANFSNTIQVYLDATFEYGKEVEKLGMLEEYQVGFKVDGEVKANINGLKTILRSKFDELDAKTLKEWLAKDWVDATVLHLASGGNFDRLWKMKMDRDKRFQSKKKS